MSFACMYLVVYVLEMCNSWLCIIQVLTCYIFAPLSATEMELVTNVEIYAFTPNLCADIDRQGGGPTGVSVEACACKLVIGSHPCGSKGGSQGQLRSHPSAGRMLCRTPPTIFIANTMTEFCNEYVFMSLLEISDGHWLLLVADLRERSFLVYNSLPSPAALWIAQ
ncbi:hypothetical protein Cgig2_033873 [Carnegiea gigantea]|uniref:Uncharacterized protein n=1 Tax=Carnegiea gigantea TaxID=171969 RepID=A0A9Q1Q8H6_9CARY|nr:hypothetical protein Cgig2_033873 [Carnegiea gigantea]